METLTAREREVTNRVVSGLLNKEVASELGITERTVKAHRRRAMSKMGAKSSAELIKMLLTIQLNDKKQKADVESIVSPENAGALKFMADLLQTSPEAFLEHLVFCHCRHQIHTRGIEYLAETIHTWMFPSRAAAQTAANKLQELTVRYNLETSQAEELYIRVKCGRYSLCRPINRNPIILSKDGNSRWNGDWMGQRMLESHD